MPEIMYPGTGLSPLTPKSVIPTNNVRTIEDVLNGIPYKMPNAGGSWGAGDDLSTSYKDDGADYKRQERDLSILNKMTSQPITSEEWIVQTDKGSKKFPSLQMAQNYKRLLGEAGIVVKWIARTKTAQKVGLSKVNVVDMALSKTFKVIVRQRNKNIENNGAAFCIEKNIFVTCAHVIKSYDKNKQEKINLFDVNNNFSIFLVNGPKKFVAKIVAVDEINDIAILSCETNTSPFEIDLVFNVGDEIAAVGSPHGFENNVSFGHITSKDRKIYAHSGAPKYMFIDANVFSGNSGGPIINVSTGLVIGMVTAIAAANGEYGLNAGLPIIHVKNFCSKNRIYLT